MLVMTVGRQERVEDLAFSPDGRALAAACRSGTHLWRAIADGARSTPLGGAHNVRGVGFTSDGRWLFSSPYELARFDTATGARASLPLWGTYYAYFEVSPTAPHLLVSQNVGYSANYRAHFALWRADDLSPAGKVWERDEAGYSHLPPRFFADGRRFARFVSLWNGADGRWELHVIVYDAATGERLTAAPVASRGVGAALLSPDGDRFALLGSTEIEFFRLGAPGDCVRFRSDTRKHFTAFAFHPSGKYLAATSNDETVKLCDPVTGREVRAFTWNIGRMRSIAFSPDGSIAAAGSDKGKVILWDVDL